MSFAIPAPALTENTPFIDMHFTQWAMSQPGRHFKPHQYLESLGFVQGVDTITETEYEILKSACEAYSYSAPEMGWTPRRFADLFTPSKSGYWINGVEGRFHPSQAVLTALAESGWVYRINPDTTYFEIINGNLIAKYQTILGSRRIAKISE